MKRRNLLRGALAAGLTAPAPAALTAARTDVEGAAAEQAGAVAVQGDRTAGPMARRERGPRRCHAGPMTFLRMCP
ncbi:hypothetical protein [Streptomyces sp. NPDC007991]|uniref:hypothetical protein n=1 Tax=Streptomyces sp. NPDC007991 TaxID=3364803 RepID=UPI0036ED8091